MKRKGFTLIELLAVIVILAIIALIATPIVLNTIENAKKGSYKSSVEGILKSAENALAMELVDTTQISEMEFNFSNGTNIDKLDFKGTKPDNGYIKINKEGKTTLLMYNDDYCAVKNYDENEIKVIKYNKDTCKGQYQDKVQYKETALKGTDPVLDSGMIPITFDGNTAKKADITSAWHDYSNRVWANVVLVKEDKREEYQSMKAGETINEADVLGYLVWIPRYKYKLFNVAGTAGTTPSTIDISFEDQNVAKSNGTADGEYLTHPGFTLGGTEANGFWVGKFETTGNATTPTIKPNLTSLRSQDISTQFDTSLKFKSNIYGITSESRMMKNEEWGAVAYLSHSIYGINTQVRLNNNSGYITGCGANTEDGKSTSECQIKYGEATAYPQSTTGNITGIFDMSGGAWEYVMGVLADDEGNPISGLSGFTNFPDDKYYTLYTSTNLNTACDGKACLGSSLGETVKWYSDYNNFINIDRSWFFRGGVQNNTSSTGIFGFYNMTGGTGSTVSFRLVV